MNYAKYEKERLWTLIESISNDSEKFLVTPESDFLKTVYSKNKYQFIACDGSDINISRNQTDKDTFFRSRPTDKGFNQPYWRTNAKHFIIYFGSKTSAVTAY